jgi:AmmeMemoRadiSam system protein A
MTDETLSPSEQKELLALARKTIEDKLLRKKVRPVHTESDNLAKTRGAFVSLHKQGNLRGCIGTFMATQPLTNTIQNMAMAAALKDPRFPSLRLEEMDEIDLEISVLSPLRSARDIKEIQVGQHGVFITRDACSGVLLPQVATEYNWDRKTFLEHTCTKADLPKDAWKDPKTKIEIFSAQVFSEKKT